MKHELEKTDWDLRAAAYHHIISTTEAPSVARLSSALGKPPTAVEQSLRRLQEHHHLVLAPGEPRLWMLHPFSATPTEYPVAVGEKTYQANCAWDALGIPAVIGRDTHTTTRCAETGAAIELGVRNGEARAADALVHFAVPARHWYDNVAFT